MTQNIDRRQANNDSVFPGSHSNLMQGYNKHIQLVFFFTCILHLNMISNHNPLIVVDKMNNPKFSYKGKELVRGRRKIVHGRLFKQL